MGTSEMAAAYDGAAALYGYELAPGSVSAEMLEGLVPRIPAGGRVVDIGCGAGRASRWLEKAGYRVLSLDLSMEMLRRTRQGRADAWVTLADLSALPVASGSFDALTAFFSLVHVPKAQVPTTLREFRRVLRRDGALLVSVRRGRNDGVTRKSWTGGHAIQFTDFVEDELDALLTVAGFRMVARESCEARMDGELTTHLFSICVAP